MTEKILSLLCVCLAVTSVLLCGCSRHASDTKPPEMDFQADYTADYQGMEIKGTLTNTRQGVFTITVDKPETLEGLCLRGQSGEITIRRNGVSATADEAYLPSNSFPSLLRRLLIDAAAGKPNGDNTYSLSCGTLATDCDRIPKSASLDGESFSVTFSNCKKIGIK